VTYSSVVVEELVQDSEEEADEDCVALALALAVLLGMEVSSTEGLSSPSSVTDGRSENSADGGHSNTPGPELNPKSSMPASPQNEQPNRIGMTVCVPSERVEVVWVLVVILDPLMVLMLFVDADVIVIVDSRAAEVDSFVLGPDIAGAAVDAELVVEGMIPELVRDTSPVEEVVADPVGDSGEAVALIASVSFVGELIPIDAILSSDGLVETSVDEFVGGDGEEVSELVKGVYPAVIVAFAELMNPEGANTLVGESLREVRSSVLVLVEYLVLFMAVNRSELAERDTIVVGTEVKMPIDLDEVFMAITTEDSAAAENLDCDTAPVDNTGNCVAFKPRERKEACS
jgi:hypothetical protein